MAVRLGNYVLWHPLKRICKKNLKPKNENNNASVRGPAKGQPLQTKSRKIDFMKNGLSNLAVLQELQTLSTEAQTFRNGKLVFE